MTLSIREKLGNLFYKHVSTKRVFFLKCYAATSVINYLLLFLIWPTDANEVLLSFGWPFYLANIIADFFAPKPEINAGMKIMVHPDVFYAILIIIIFVIPMMILVSKGLRHDKRRKGAVMICAGLLIPANFVFYILSMGFNLP